MLAAQAIKFGYRWKVGNRKQIQFWEDTWFGTAPLAVQFWELYCICNEKSKKIADIWVQGELRVTFRRTFTEGLMQSWRELFAVMEETILTDEADALIWCYNKSGVYSTQSFYCIISYRGITPLYIPAVWNICVPPKFHLFLWLLSHNKLATIDNLNKKGISKPVQCRFCGEDESIGHLFFSCVVARSIWEDVSEFLGFEWGLIILL
jgi:hypothetical protein